MPWLLRMDFTPALHWRIDGNERSIVVHDIAARLEALEAEVKALKEKA